MKSSRKLAKENVPPSVGKSKIPLPRITAVRPATPKKETLKSKKSPPRETTARAPGGRRKGVKRECSPTVPGVTSSPPKVTRRHILGELPCDQRRILKVRKERGDENVGKPKTSEAETLDQYPGTDNQKDIPFETDDSALASILNNTGIRTATKTPVPVRHTMAAIGSSKRPSIYGPPKKYGLAEFQRTCDELIHRSSMIQPNVKRQRLAEQAKTTESTGFKFPSLRTTPRSQRCPPVPAWLGQTIPESPVFKKQFTLAAAPFAQSRNAEGKQLVSQTGATSRKANDSEQNEPSRGMGTKENSDTSKQQKSMAGNIAKESKQMQGSAQGRASEINAHTPGRVLRSNAATRPSDTMPYTPGRVLKQNLFTPGKLSTSSNPPVFNHVNRQSVIDTVTCEKLSTSNPPGVNRELDTDATTCGKLSTPSGSTTSIVENIPGVHTPMRVAKPADRASYSSRFSEVGPHTPLRVAKPSEKTSSVSSDNGKHTPLRVVKPTEKALYSTTSSAIGPHTPQRVAKPTSNSTSLSETSLTTPIRVSKPTESSKPLKSPGRLLKQVLDAQYKKDRTPRRELAQSVATGQYRGTPVTVDLTPRRQMQIKQEPGTSLNTPCRTPVTKAIIGQSSMKTLSWAVTLEKYKSPFIKQSPPEQRESAPAVFRFGKTNDDTLPKTNFSFELTNCNESNINDSGAAPAATDVLQVGHESSKPGPENQESGPTRKVASLQDAMQNDPSQEPRITSPLTSTQHATSPPSLPPIIPPSADATGTGSLLSRRVHQTLHSPSAHEYHGAVTQSGCTAAECVHESQGEMTQIDTFPCQGPAAVRSKHFGNELQFYQGQQSRNEQNDKLQQQIRLFEEKKQQLLELQFKIQQQLRDESLANLGQGDVAKNNNGNTINTDLPVKYETILMQNVNNDQAACDEQNYVDVANGNHVCPEGQTEVITNLPNFNSQGWELTDGSFQDVNSNVCVGIDLPQANYACSVSRANEAHSSKCYVAKVEKFATPTRESKLPDCDDVDITPFILRENNNNNKPRWADCVPSTNRQMQHEPSTVNPMSLSAQFENQVDTCLFNPLPLQSTVKREHCHEPVKSPEKVNLPIWTPLALKTVAKQLEVKSGFTDNSRHNNTDTLVPQQVKQVAIETKPSVSRNLERQVLSFDKVPTESSADATTKHDVDKLAGLGTDIKCDTSIVGTQTQYRSNSPNNLDKNKTEQNGDFDSSNFTTIVPKTPPSKSSAFHSVNRSSLTPTIGSLSLRANSSKVDRLKRKHDPLHETLFREVNERYNEALLDDEVARYASRLVVGSVGKRGRTCYNPVAKTLLEGDTMHFVPITDESSDDRSSYLLETSAFSRCTRST